jgi:hypothetical protein
VLFSGRLALQYLILIPFFIVFYWLANRWTKGNIRAKKLFLIIIVISLVVVATLSFFSYHYKKIDALAAIILLLVSFFLGMSCIVRKY